MRAMADVSQALLTHCRLHEGSWVSSMIGRRSLGPVCVLKPKPTANPFAVPVNHSQLRLPRMLPNELRCPGYTSTQCCKNDFTFNIRWLEVTIILHVVQLVESYIWFTMYTPRERGLR